MTGRIQGEPRVCAEQATAAAPALLCDEMLAGLARWLRAAGHDTALAAPGSPDRDLLARSHDEQRLLLTRDRALLRCRLAAGHTLLLHGTGFDAWAAELRATLDLDWLHAPFSRCLLDNLPLRAATAAERATLPVSARALGDDTHACDACGRLYWPGSHVRRMRARLERWQDGAADV